MLKINGMFVLISKNEDELFFLEEPVKADKRALA
jgi:hypothetical protein